MNPAHTNAVPDSPLQPPLRLRWRADLGTAYSNTLVTGGRVFYVRDAGSGLQLTALDVADGHVLWSQEVAPRETAYLAADAGRLFVLTRQSAEYPYGVRVRALDQATGTQAWQRDIASEYGPGAWPTVADGQLFLLESSASQTLYALRQSDGKDLWAPKGLSSGNDSTPALDAENVYVSLAGHRTHAFRRTDGALRWLNEDPCCSGGGGMAPIVHGGRVYAFDNHIHAASDGAIVGWYRSSWLAFTGDTGLETVLGDVRGFAPGYDATRWTVDLPWFTAWSRPLVAGDHAYVSGGDGQEMPDTLMAIRVADGTPAWCTRPQVSVAESYVGPVAAGDGILVVGGDTALAAYESGGEGSACVSRDRGPGPAPVPEGGDGGGDGGGPSLGTVDGPTLMMRVGRRQLFLGDRTRVIGRLAGLPDVAGRRVVLELDDFPFEGRFRRGARAAAASDGLVRFWVEPARNVRVRLRLERTPEVASAPQTVFADFRMRIRRLGGGGPAPRLRATVTAARGAPIRRKVLHAYLLDRARKQWRRVAGRRWPRGGARSASITFRYPSGRLGRRDRVLVCTREAVSDGFGRPHPLERVCGAPTMPRVPI